MIIPGPLLPGLLKYLVDTEEVPEQTVQKNVFLVGAGDQHLIDYPGPAFMVRRYHEVNVSGLSLRIPSTDFSGIFRELKDLPLSSEGGVQHYRLYSAIRCLCLTPELRDKMLKEMGKQLPAAIEIADCENREFNLTMGGVKDSKIGGILVGPANGSVLSAKPVIDREIESA
jgi:hypothetical protein